jgi:hypothetical protein
MQARLHALLQHLHRIRNRYSPKLRVMDQELKERLDAIDAAIDELYLFHGRLSPRLAATRPAYLRDAGEDGSTFTCVTDFSKKQLDPCPAYSAFSVSSRTLRRSRWTSNLLGKRLRDHRWPRDGKGRRHRHHDHDAITDTSVTLPRPVLAHTGL